MSTHDDLSTNALRALRGATTVERDEPDLVVEATAELLRAMIERNDLAATDLVSIVFTATPDLTSEFPAKAARALGLANVPLLCAAEMAVPDALPLCIRVLLHAYTPVLLGELKHVYLRDARGLRTDLDEN
jgi:chorismate mutase